MSERAPMWPGRLLRVVLARAEAEELLGDLQELFDRRVARDGVRAARRWYVRQCLSCAWHLGVKRLFGISAAGAHVGMSTAGDGRKSSGMPDLPRELAAAVRMLVRRPVYALTVIMTLGIGVAGVSIVYSIANWVLLRPVPSVTGANELSIAQLALAGGGGPIDGGMPISQPDAAALAERTSHLALITASAPQELHFAPGGTRDAVRIPGEFVWPNYFGVLGSRPLYGRALQNDTSSAVAVISERLAERYWPRARDAVGTVVQINGIQTMIVGVAAHGFHGAELPGSAEIWVPTSMIPAALHSPDILGQSTAQLWSTLIARRKPGVHAADLERAMNEAVALIRRESPMSFLFPPVFAFHVFDSIGLHPSLQVPVGRMLRIVGMAALALLLLTGANVTNMGLTRAASTSSQAAVRRALGAGSVRIIREQMLECLVLGAGGALLATALTIVAMKSVQSITLLRGTLSLAGIHADGRVIAVGVVAALLVSVLAGMIPAFTLARFGGAQALRSARHGDARSMRTRNVLVVAQVALSIVLVSWAALLTRTLYNLHHIDLGFEQAGVATFALDPDLQGYTDAQSLSFMRRLVDALQSRPEIAAAAITDHGLFAHFWYSASIRRDDAPRSEDALHARRWQMSPDLLRVLRIPVVAGSAWDAQWTVRDTNALKVGMLNETAARNIFPDVPPAAAVGRTILLDGRKETRVLVTGIVRDARLTNVMADDKLYFYQPWSQGWIAGQFTVYVRAKDVSLDVRPIIQKVAHSLDANLPVYGLRTLGDEVDEQIAEQRFTAHLSLALAVTGIILAMLGLYGTLSYAVHERLRELGVRSALGAQPSELLSRVLVSGLTLTAVGVVGGLVAAVYLSRFLASRMYGISRFDGTTYMAVSLTLFAVAAAASAIPGWRAARVDPMTVLRTE